MIEDWFFWWAQGCRHVSDGNTMTEWFQFTKHLFTERKTADIVQNKNHKQWRNKIYEYIRVQLDLLPNGSEEISATLTDIFYLSIRNSL
jgi:hypothetical protein